VTGNHRTTVEGLANVVSRVAADYEQPLDCIHALEGHIASAVRDPYWLAAPFRRVQGRGVYYLLWRDAETDVSLLAMVLGPGEETPIHDHLTWGVVGVYEGTQRETRFVRRGDSLQETTSLRRQPGSITHLLPPDDDIHFVRNESTAPAVSVFVMGSNIGCRPRHQYDRAGGSEEVVSGYANVHCAGQARNPFFVSPFM
jgi:3-mercaptopropionate dioxygenase